MNDSILQQPCCFVASYRLLVSSGATELYPGPATRCQKLDKTVTKFNTDENVSMYHNGVIRELLFVNVKLEDLNTTSINPLTIKVPLTQKPVN